MSQAQETLDQFTPDAAWKPYVPDASNPWDEIRVAHLYRRAGFGAAWSVLQAGTKSSPAELISRIMAGPAAAVDRQFESEVAKLAEGVAKGNDALQAKALWLYRMLHSLPVPPARRSRNGRRR